MSAVVSIPGTTSNLGPGFDSFGLALGISNLVTVSLKKPSRPLPEMVETTAESFFHGSGLSPIPFSWKISGSVPQARGLGSSVTVRLGTLIGLNHLSGSPLSRLGLFRLCSELEGHPDNAAPAMFGGYTISRAHHAPLRYPVSLGLYFVLLIPNFEVATPEARKALPRFITTPDAAANAADAAVIAAAFATKKYDLLRGSFGDRLHQPQRSKLVPFLYDVVAAGENAGAFGGWLSGSGSTICCLAPDQKSASRISLAMKRSAPKLSKVIVCHADNSGAHLAAT